MSAKSSLKWLAEPQIGSTNAVVGARVSTSGQDERETPEVQLALTERHARENGYHVVGVMREVITGTAILARRVLREVFDAARAGRVQVLVLAKYDRTGRGNAQTILEYEAGRAGLRIEYVGGQPDVSTPAGAIMHAVQNTISEVERQGITERFMRGKYERSRRGQIMLPPRIPFGYKAVRTFDDMGRRISATLEIDEAKIAIYHRARRMLVEDGITLRQICKRFNEENIPGPTGGRWGLESLRVIMRNSIYAGEYRYGLRIKKRVDTEDGIKQVEIGRRGPGEYVSVPTPAVITKEQYADILATIEDNIKRFERPRKYNYLLAGMIKCALCGKSYNGCPTVDQGKVTLRYRCRNNNGENHKCSAKDISAGLMEKTVWALVDSFIVDPSLMASGEDEKRRRQLDAVSIDAEIAAQQKLIDTKSKELQGVILLQASLGEAGAESAAAFVASMAAIQQQINTAKAIMASIEQRRVAIQAMRESEVEAGRLRAELVGRLERLKEVDEIKAFEGKQHILRRIRLACVWNSETRMLTVSSLLGSSQLHIAKRH